MPELSCRIYCGDEWHSDVADIVEVKAAARALSAQRPRVEVEVQSQERHPTDKHGITVGTLDGE